MTGPTAVQVVAFYRFVSLSEPAAVAAALRQRCVERALRGTVVVAGEGINGSLSGPPAVLAELVQWLVSELEFPEQSFRFSPAAQHPFDKLVVRTSAQILPDPASSGIRPEDPRGDYVEPDQWDALLDAGDVRLIDVRNAYEVSVGSFVGAETPATDRFSEFGEWAAAQLDPARDQHVAMFCTGGIRCEKASAWLLRQGFKRISQLRGGVLNYLEQRSGAGGRWRGACFVFDHRVALTRELGSAGWVVCHGCRQPVSPDAQQQSDYQPGVTCPACAVTLAPARRRMLEHRASQFLQAAGSAGNP